MTFYQIDLHNTNTHTWNGVHIKQKT